MINTYNVIEQIADYKNLSLAFYKACKGKRIKKKKAIDNYKLNYKENLLNLHNELLNGHITLGNYNVFTVYEPKKRKIYAAEFKDRILHHALMNILDPRFEEHFIFHTFACRKGKGIDLALKYAQKYCEVKFPIGIPFLSP